MEILMVFSGFGQQKTNPISRPSAGVPKSEYLNPKRVERMLFEKQSQFAIRPNRRKVLDERKIWQ
jgi:hypothetical protein